MVLIKDGDAVVGWFINPYVRIGAEWGRPSMPVLRLSQYPVTKTLKTMPLSDGPFLFPSWLVSKRLVVYKALVP